MLKSVTIGLLLLYGLLSLPAHGQIANLIGSVGAINQSMGGAATAMPLDAAGSQFWNPAGITDLETTELDNNIQPIFPIITLSSSLQENALAPGLPPKNLSGESESSTKAVFLPSLAYVKKFEQNPWRLGFLVTGTGGSSVKFSHHRDNPFTAPPPIGSGNIKVMNQFLQLSPTVAYSISKRWSVGIQPNISFASLKAQPFSGAEPLDLNHDGIPTYPRTNQAWAPGLGVQGGIYYHNPKLGLHLGSSIKSPQWFLPFHFKTTYFLESHEKSSASFRNTIPMIVSIGAGYSGIPKLKIASDLRYVDFANATGFNQAGFTKRATTKGLGWQSIWAVATGAQYQVTEKFSIRSGYAYNQSPVLPANTVFSVGSPSVVKHEVSVGFSYQFNPHMTIATAYEHGFAGSSQGPIQSPSGPIPGSSIKLKTALNSFVIGLIMKF